MKLRLRLNDSNGMFWNTRKFMSYYPDIWMDIAIGGRGIGKTTGALISACRMFNKDGSEFIYLRRYKPELKKFVGKKSLDPIVEGVRYVPQDGTYTFKVGDSTIGYGICLSTGVDFKSCDFSRVRMIIYDECTVRRKATKRYLPDEVVTLLEFISSVVRLRKDYRVLLLGNNIDLFNPYFSYFDVPRFDGLHVDRKRGLMCELPKNSPKLIAEERKTPLFRLIDGTAYGRYHYDNEVLMSGRECEVLKAPPKQLNRFIRVVVRGTTLDISFYSDAKSKRQMFYVSSQAKEAKGENVYMLTDGDKVNYFYMDYFKKRCKAVLNRFYYDGRCAFDDAKTADIFAWIMEEIQ